jgi:hypothetical protein
MDRKKMKVKTRSDVLKGGLNVTFALKPKRGGFMVSGVWVSDKLWKHNLKRYKGDSYRVWKTLSEWFKKRQHMLDIAARNKYKKKR